MVEAGMVWCGPPDQVREQIIDQVTTAGCGNVLPHTALGHLGIEKIRRSQELFAREVLPVLGELEVADAT